MRIANLLKNHIFVSVCNHIDMTEEMLEKDPFINRTIIGFRHLIPVAVLIASLALFSLALGMSLINAILFWFLLVPIITYFTSRLVYKERLKFYHLLANFILFYGFMVFMIYKHYQSDLFHLMLISLAWNIFIFGLYYFYKMLDKRESSMI